MTQNWNDLELDYKGKARPSPSDADLARFKEFSTAIIPDVLGRLLTFDYRSQSVYPVKTVVQLGSQLKAKEERWLQSDQPGKNVLYDSANAPLVNVGCTFHPDVWPPDGNSFHWQIECDADADCLSWRKKRER